MSVTYIVGAGGIGCAVGYALLEAGRQVVFVDVDAAKIEFGRANGILLDDRDPRPASFEHFENWCPVADCEIFLTTKCYDNAAVFSKIPNWTVIPVQNGYEPQAHANSFDVGIASFVAHCEPGTTRTRITRPGAIHFGPQFLVNGNAFNRTIFPKKVLDVRHVRDIRPIKATKLMYNAAISPIAAAAGLDNGALLSEPKAQKLFFDLIQENYRILTAAGVPLGKVGPFHPRTVSKILNQRWLAKLMAKRFERSLRGTYCSMAGEIEKGRTELDNYTGHLLRLAGDNIPAPINRRVYEVVSRMTRERIPPHWGVIDELSS